MSTQRFDLLISQNATYQLDGQWLSAGVPVNLTGYTLAAHIRSNPKARPILFDLIPTITNAIEGRWRIIVTDEQSVLWKWYEGVWDIRAEAPQLGVARRLLQGLVVVSPAVTRL